MSKLKLMNSLLALTCVLFLLSGCTPKSPMKAGKKNDLLSVVPAEATNITSFNVANLMNKSDWESVKAMEFFQNAVKEAKEENAAMAKIMETPEESGINLSNTMYSFTKMGGDENDPEVFTGVVMSLNDANKFAKMLEDAGVGGFEKGDGFSYARPEGDAIVAWNDNMAVIGGGAGKNGMVETAKEVLSSDRKSTVANNAKIRKAFAGGHDIQSVVNFDGYIGMMGEMVKSSAAMIGYTEDDLMGNYIYTYADFEDGKLTSKGTYDLKDVISKDLNMLFRPKVETNFKKNLPGEDLIGMLTFAMDVKGTNQLLEEKGVAGGANMALIRFGFSTKDIVNGLGGDMVLASYGSSDGGENPDLLFATNIKDQDFLSKLIELGKESKALMSDGEDLYTIMGTSMLMKDMVKELGGDASKTQDAQLLVKDDVIYISARRDVIAQIQKGGFKGADQVDGKLYNDLANNIFGMFIDFNSIKPYVKPLQDLDLGSMKSSTTKESSDFILETANKNENVLKTIFKMINEAYKKEELNLDLDDEDNKGI